MKKKSLTSFNAHSKDGFTLIEVIVAVSIVVILASLTVPKVSAYIDKARNSKAVNAGKQIYTAAMWSYTDQGNSFVKTSVSEAITSFAGIKNTDVVSVDTASATNTNEINISFKSDNNTFTLAIDAGSSVYTITKSGATTPLFTSN